MTARGRNARHGFTLVELLIVIGIIVLLMSVLFFSFRGAFSSRDEARATATIETLRGNLESFEARWGVSPPGNLKDLSALTRTMNLMPPNDLNEGIETLVLALRMQREGGPYLDGELFADDGRRSNLDADNVLPEVAGPGGLDLPEDSSPELFEVLDPWGNPLVYVNIAELRQGVGQQSVQLASGEVVVIDLTTAQEKLRHPVTGQFPAGYAIWSFGEDGVNDYGRGDDITSWAKYEDVK
ncbi:MAG: type II secretion system protein [Planctomycetes bacterium]|nr:type II secretion system protein [Planctomycetota bacterium]